jgi:hypothetical protein
VSTWCISRYPLMGTASMLFFFLKGSTQRDVQGRRRNIALEHNPNGKFGKHSITVVTDSSESDKQVSDSE